MVKENNNFKELEKKELVELEGGNIVPIIPYPIVPMMIIKKIAIWMANQLYKKTYIAMKYV